MKRLFTMILLLCSIAGIAHAQRITRNFQNVSMSDALKYIQQQTGNHKIVFIYNELEDFTVTTHVKNKPVPDAIRQIIGFYPIQMILGENNDIYVECIHKTEHHLKGLVVDENNLPLPYANVTLLNPADSTMVGGGVTNESGRFVIPNDHGKVIARITYVGYKTAYRQCSRDNVGTIKMQTDQFALSGVTIKGSRIHHDATGYTINLRSSDIAKGKQASDMLAFLPGVSKEEDTYKINGLQASEIYVDGVKLTSKDELKNIPADMIDKVKVKYFAGVNQDAASAGGTIEITLHKPSEGSYYGSVWGGAEYKPSFGFSDENLGALIYYRYKNLSIYDNLSLSLYQPQETAKQSIWDQAEDLLTEIDEEVKFKWQTLSNRLSLTHNISDKSYLGGSYYISTNKHKYTTLDRGATGLSSVEGRSSYLFQEVTLKYNTSSLSQRGTTLEIIGDYYNRQSDSKSGYTYAQNPSSMSEDKTMVSMYKFSVDLTDPRSQKLVWKYGASLQYITSKYTPIVGAVDGSDRFQTSQEATRTSGLTPLVYASAMGQIWKIQYSAGANFQLNRIWYKTLDDGKTSTDTQWGINPTVQLMMPFGSNEKHALMFNYKRILKNIPYSAISSTISWSDPYNYTVGNPDLKATAGSLVMAGVSLFHNLLSLDAIYSRITNRIHWETRQSPIAPDVFYTTPINMPALNGGGAGVSFNWSPVKPWTMKLSGRYEILSENLTLGGVYYGKTRLRQYYDMYNNFSFEHGWGGMLNINYEPTFKDYDRTYYTVWNVDGQIYKSMCNDKLQLRISFSALGDRRKYDRQANGRTITYDYTTPVQSVGISLHWKFSGGKNQKYNVVNSGSQNYEEIKDIH